LTVAALGNAVKKYLEEKIAEAQKTGTGQVEVGTITSSITPVQSLNYAMLHNNRPIFEQFQVKPVTPWKGSIRVIVSLFQGESSAPFKGLFAFDNLTPRELRDDIRVPLTSGLLRSLKEPVRSTLHVRITDVDKPPRLLEEKTYRVTLLP